MPREYRHMKQYEKEILELKAKGLTQRKRQIVSVKSTCISKMPSQRTFSETANSYLHLLGSTFRGSIPGQQLAKFFWLSKI